ncbi:hypothetical protein LJR071_004161 [Pseudomonas sp. LjRoot71]|uniref:hypothetical protein n=1 Tax=Pseudomonas sp. LjRoot71 TaxID=3342336 RepID=UPI003ECCED29
MRKATLVLATSVAFLLFGVPNSYAGTKKKVQMPTAQSVANGSGVPVKSGNSLSIPGALQGEFIPGDNPSRTTPIKVLPTIDFSVPRTINAVKGILKNNAASIAVGGVIAGMIAGLDWVMSPDNTQIQVREQTPGSYTPTGSQYAWALSNPNGTPAAGFSSPTAACAVLNSIDPSKPHVPISTSDPLTFNCSNSTWWTTRYGSSCPSGLTYNSTLGTCTGTQLVPLRDSDLSLVDAYATAQSSQWLKDLLRESCSGSLAPDRCYEDLKDNVSLTGPSTVSGPTSISTTTGPNGTTTKETKTNYQITYGSDYFIYAPTTTTTTVNPDGTTEVETEEETTEEEAQEDEIDSTIGDPYAPVITKYNDIASGVSDLEGNMSFINYGPWYSFGGSCSPITLNLPVMGTYTIDHCPYVIDWIRPTLGFLFAVWTWLHCFALWRETLQNARPI